MFRSVETEKTQIFHFEKMTNNEDGKLTFVYISTIRVLICNCPFHIQTQDLELFY